MKASMHKKRRERAAVMLKLAQQLEQSTIGLQAERNADILTSIEKILLLRCEEMGLKAAGIMRRVALRMETKP